MCESHVSGCQFVVCVLVNAHWMLSRVSPPCTHPLWVTYCPSSKLMKPCRSVCAYTARVHTASTRHVIEACSRPSRGGVFAAESRVGSGVFARSLMLGAGSGRGHACSRAMFQRRRNVARGTARVECADSLGVARLSVFRRSVTMDSAHGVISVGVDAGAPTAPRASSRRSSSPRSLTRAVFGRCGRRPTAARAGCSSSYGATHASADSAGASPSTMGAGRPPLATSARAAFELHESDPPAAELLDALA